MKQEKIEHLRKKDWVIGDALDFVNIGITNPEELVKKNKTYKNNVN